MRGGLIKPTSIGKWIQYIIKDDTKQYTKTRVLINSSQIKCALYQKIKKHKENSYAKMMIISYSKSKEYFFSHKQNLNISLLQD